MNFVNVDAIVNHIANVNIIVLVTVTVNGNASSAA